MDERCPAIWKLSPCGKYSCVCGWKFEYEDCEEHMKSDFPGFMECGIRYNESEMYDCICGKTNIPTRNSAYMHYSDNGMNCMKRAMNKMRFYCDTCHLYFDCFAKLRRHEYTKKHEEMKYEERPTSLHCEICDITCKGQKQMIAHLKTKKHQRNETGTNVNYCAICNIHCKGEKEMVRHVNTKKHKKNESTY